MSNVKLLTQNILELCLKSENCNANLVFFADDNKKKDISTSLDNSKDIENRIEIKKLKVIKKKT